ncbi:hypothetical protein PLEOSDRAFT_1105182 [Pleurotus ostreatus PC15]|uniref:Uncharacterized protein n=1 Tax=Pleurotus ostreatus (strain PC15) TaxID=1137138 RepID=A0A067NRN7_PLEO1|nr:hypothetical protein PLEOSDRAFT_1105182 [Pleurotus ostreatus PC15]
MLTHMLVHDLADVCTSDTRPIFEPRGALISDTHHLPAFFQHLLSSNSFFQVLLSAGAQMQQMQLASIFIFNIASHHSCP